MAHGKEPSIVNAIFPVFGRVSGLVPLDLVERARHDSTLCRSILRRYKRSVVQQQAKKRDDAEFMAVCDTWQNLAGDFAPADWDGIKVWAFVCPTGLWPPQLFDHGTGCETLPLCAEVDVDAAHCLHVLSWYAGYWMFRNSGACALAPRQLETSMFFAVLASEVSGMFWNQVC